MTAKLSADNLTLIRGERCLFEGLGFALHGGEMLLLEGRNGCGKTSLMRAIAGMLSLETGQVLWNDIPVLKQRQTFHGALVWLAHRTGLKGDLNMVENLHFEESLRPQSDLDHEEIFTRLGIERLKRLPLRSLSAGQQRRVALARMLLANVPLWLLDEPFTNLDREGRKLVMELVEEHLSTGGLCVMAAHQDVEIKAPVTKIRLQ
ncbi:MAG: cytochrome c biogenesis heme-transporting ATPase CcmA [Gammaproteobacteria bacterium]|nr:cytochrome c biogenesis heme-transporting ATPase CcmA [Gammaproteobacteria bacterium]